MGWPLKYITAQKKFMQGQQQEEAQWNTQWAGGLGEEEGMTKKGCIMIHYT